MPQALAPPAATERNPGSLTVVPPSSPASRPRPSASPPQQTSESSSMTQPPVSSSEATDTGLSWRSMSSITDGAKEIPPQAVDAPRDLPGTPPQQKRNSSVEVAHEAPAPRARAEAPAKSEGKPVTFSGS